jgi:hypothetical protein
MASQPDEALAHLAEAEQVLETTNDRWVEAEMCRLRGRMSMHQLSSAARSPSSWPALENSKRCRPAARPAAQRNIADEAVPMDAVPPQHKAPREVGCPTTPGAVCPQVRVALGLSFGNRARVPVGKRLGHFSVSRTERERTSVWLKRKGECRAARVRSAQIAGKRNFTERARYTGAAIATSLGGQQPTRHVLVVVRRVRDGRQ